MSSATVGLALLVAGAMSLGAPTVTGDTAIAKKDKALVSCPKKVGKFTLDDLLVHPTGTGQRCQYQHFLKPGRLAPGSVSLTIDWVPDVQGERSACLTRNPQPTRRDDYARAWTLESPTRKAHAFINVTSNAKVGTKQVLAALRMAVAAAEPLGHPCVPEVEPVRSEGLTCPLLLTGDLVRSDWLHSSMVPPAIEDSLIPGETYELACAYRPTYADEGGEAFIRVTWDVADPPLSRLCIAEELDTGSRVRRTTGHHPVEIEVNDEFLERWGVAAEALATGLSRAAAARTRPCPDAPDGPAPYEEDGTPAGTTTTTIVLSGGKDDEPPPIGAAIAVPEDEQHRIVIGGLDGEVIREEFIGDQVEISGYGPIATDAEGNWSVLVDVEVSTAPALAPASPVPSGAPPSPLPSPALSAAPAPSAEPLPPASASPLPASSATPGPAPSLTPAPEPVASPEPAFSSTPVPPPEAVGMPEALADFVAGLEPEAAGAVRNLTDHLVVLGDELLATGRGEVTIPASDIAELQRLAPGFVDKIRLVPGGFIVDSYIDIRVTPIIGADGLVEFRTDRLPDKIRSHSIVKALVVALNNYVVESGGVFRTISVTSEGLTVTAERPPVDRSAL